MHNYYISTILLNGKQNITFQKLNENFALYIIFTFQS
jgi:hypothetical protein